MQQPKGKDNDEMIKLNPIFCDNMIMQAGKPVRVFGTGAGTVKITLDNETKSVQADGKWLVEFPQKSCLVQKKAAYLPLFVFSIDIHIMNS